jgi:hypothetical protein
MADETKHGAHTPPGQNRAGRGPQVECSEFEGLVSDALEGHLSPGRMEGFDAHRRTCPICGPLFADVQAGQQWLRTLEAVEPPAQLVHNILAATTGVLSTRPLAAAADGRTTPLGERWRERWDSFSASFFRPVAAFVRQPRFVMSFGMIFFSFSLALNAAGVKASDVSKVDLRPAALRHAYNDAQIKVVQYYDNIRFVYEIESKLRQLKRANPPAEPGPGSSEPKENRKNNNTSGQPDQRQDRNYSQEYNQPVLAEMTEGSNGACSYELRAASYEQTQARSGLEARGSKPPVVTVTTNRRFV